MEVIEVKRIQDTRRQVLNEDSKERQVFEEQQLETRLLPLVWTVVGLK